jgi:hypothetical protein
LGQSVTQAVQATAQQRSAEIFARTPGVIGVLSAPKTQRRKFLAEELAEDRDSKWLSGKAPPFNPNLRDYWEDRQQRRLVREAGRFNRHLAQTARGSVAACRAAFDAELDQHDNTTIVVPRLRSPSAWTP